MSHFRPALVLLTTMLCLAASASAAQAACTTWSGGNGKWSEASHWGGKVPGPEEEACINSSTVEISGEGANVKSLTVGGGATIDVIATSYIYGGETQNVTQLFVGSASFAAGSHLLLEATEGGSRSGTEPKGAGAFLTGGPIAFHGQLETKVADPAWPDRIKVAGLKLEPGSTVAVDSGTLKFIQEGEGGYPWSATNEGTFTVAPGATVEMQPSFAGSAAFTNAGSVVNNGSIVGYGVDWAQTAGSASGNPIVLDSGSTLTDSAGTGSFLGAYQLLNVTGTIPAGQTVTVRGEVYNYQGENYNSTTLSTAGKELVNDGTLILNPTGEGSTGGQVNVGSGSIHNNGTIDVTTETPSRLTLLEEGITNGPSGHLEINGGILEGNPGGVTNEGLVTLAPTAAILLEEGGAFLNKGTFSPEIAGPGSYGTVKLQSPCCSGSGTFTAGGTLSPILIGGYLPAAGLDLPVFKLEGGKFEGTFASVGNGFAADYTHESSEGAYVGIYRGASAGPGPGGGVKAATAHVISVLGGRGKVTVTASCPAGGGACTTLTVTVTVVEHLKHGRLSGLAAKRTVTTRTVVIATGSIALAAGARRTVSFALDAAGRALLSHFAKISAIAKVSSGATVLSRATVHLQRPAVKKKR